MSLYNCSDTKNETNEPAFRPLRPNSLLIDLVILTSLNRCSSSQRLQDAGGTVQPIRLLVYAAVTHERTHSCFGFTADML